MTSNVRLLILSALTLPLILLGYGSDNDTYAVLDAGRTTWLEGDPTMSRRPGYWLFEALVLGLDRIGGFVATNLATLGVSIALLAWFARRAQMFGVSNVTLLTACLALNPWFLIAATSTTDHMWSLLASALVIESLLKNRPVAGGLWAGIAGALRLSALPTLAGAVIGQAASNPSGSVWRRWVIIAMPIAGCFLVAAYLPSWWVVGHDWSFLQGYLGDEGMWTPKMHLGRFIYKTIYLFGLPAFLLLGILICRHLLYSEKRFDFPRSAWILIGAAGGNLLLFARFPLETFYLLPFLTCFLLIIGIWLNPSKRALIVLLLASASYSVINVPLAKPNVAFGATDASIGLSVEKGVLWKDIEDRLAVYHCKTQACWKAHSNWVIKKPPTPSTTP